MTTTIPFSGFNHAACALTCPSASHTPSPGSHFGSAAGLLARLWPDETFLPRQNHPLGDKSEFQCAVHTSHHFGFISARPSEGCGLLPEPQYAIRIWCIRMLAARALPRR
jgi:hypothetical protein